jgi:hypothetical protein
MTLYFPEAVQSLGRETLLYVPTLNEPTAATVDEVTAEGAINISCAIRTFNATAEQSKVKKYRLCSKQGFDSLGRVEWTIDRPSFIDDPQAEDDDEDYPHKALVPGTTGYLLRRRGLDSDPEGFVDWAAGQRYQAFPVEFGVRVPNQVNPEEDGQEFEYEQEIAVIGEVVDGTVTASGGGSGGGSPE